MFENEVDDEPVGEFEDGDRNHHQVIHIFLLFIFLWQSLFRISDGALSLMLAFMGKFFHLVSIYLRLDALCHMAQLFPKTLYRAKKTLGKLQENFIRFVSCPTCHKLYTLEESQEVGSHGKKVSRYCDFIRYPRHPQVRMHTTCGSMLLKCMKSSKGSEFLSPFNTYCYRSPILGLEALLNRPNMMHFCEAWRHRRIKQAKLCDI